MPFQHLQSPRSAGCLLRSSLALTSTGLPFILTYKPSDFFEERILLVLMRRWRTSQGAPGHSFCISLHTLTHSSMLKVWARRLGLTPALLRAWITSLVGRSNSADRTLRSCFRL